MSPGTAAVDSGAEPDEEKPDTPVKRCFVKTISEHGFVLDSPF